MLFALLYALLRRVIGSGRPSADRKLETEVVERVGRPPIDPALAALIRRMGGENPRWGYMRIK